MNEDLKRVLRMAEIKRVAERLSKKELCTIYGLNYNFYMNCISGRNFPSQKMVESLEGYLKTASKDVYDKVFASRPLETKYHEALSITNEDQENFIHLLREENILQEPRA